MRKFKIEAQANGKVANVRITGRINEWGVNNSEAFRSVIEKLIAKGATDCQLYLNSGGGDVFVANEIVNILDLFPGRVDANGGALIASAATYIAAHCDSLELSANSRMMLHKPKAYFSGSEDDVKSKLKLLKSMTSEYRTLYAGIMGITEDAVENLWIKGDVWYNAQEAKSAGLCTSIRPKKAKMAADMVAEFVAENCPVEYLPQVESKSQNLENQMDKTINPLAIGLTADATQGQIDAKLAEIQAKALKADSLEAAAASKAEADAKKLVDDLITAAIATKKITADQKETYIEIATANYDAAKKAIDAMLPIEKLSGKINTEKKPKGDRTGWTYADYLEKDPEALEAMRTEDEDAFEALYQDYYTED